MLDTPTLSGNRTAALVVALLLVVGVAAPTVLATAGAQSDGDAPDERGQAEPLALGETVEGNVSDGEDVDWYRVDAVTGDALLAELRAEKYENRSFAVRLYNESGGMVAHVNGEGIDGRAYVGGDTQTGGNEPFAVGADVAEYGGPYYVKVSWYDAPLASDTNESLTVPYNLTVTASAMGEHDPNEDGSTAAPLSVGASTEDVIAPYDYDAYAVQLEGGTNYTFQFDSGPGWKKQFVVYGDAANATESTRIDPEDPLYSLGGATEEETTRFTPGADGTYYLVIAQAGANSEFLTTDAYTVQIERTNPSDAGTATPTPTPTATPTASPTPTATPTSEPPSEPPSGPPSRPPSEPTTTPTPTPTPTSSETEPGAEETETSTPAGGVATPTDGSPRTETTTPVPTDDDGGVYGGEFPDEGGESTAAGPDAEPTTTDGAGDIGGDDGRTGTASATATSAADPSASTGTATAGKTADTGSIGGGELSDGNQSATPTAPSGPGFGPLAALAGVLATALLALRRD